MASEQTKSETELLIEASNKTVAAAEEELNNSVNNADNFLVRSSCISIDFVQELTDVQEEALSQTISNEHAKQLHWKETLKIEAQQLKAAKARKIIDLEAKQKQAVLDRKTVADLQFSQEDARRKAAVENLSRDIADDSEGSALHSIAKTLSEFLSKSANCFVFLA